MPTFLEYDRTSSEIRRIITADEPPPPVAHLAYQQVPDGIEVDLSMKLTEILEEIKNNIETKEDSPSEAPVSAAAVKNPPFLEM